MDKKTNKGKLEIFKLLRISALSQGQPLIKLEVIIPYLEILQKYRVFLHAEFISAMKTVQNPTIFVKNTKKKKKQKNDQFW